MLQRGASKEEKGRLKAVFPREGIWGKKKKRGEKNTQNTLKSRRTGFPDLFSVKVLETLCCVRAVSCVFCPCQRLSDLDVLKS